MKKSITMNYQDKKSLKTIKYAFFFIFVMALAGVACEGPTGSDGPQGPQGEQGQRGEQGNANVMYSDWMDVTWGYGAGGKLYKLISESRITPEFLDDGGLVLMFMRSESNSGVIRVSKLPLVFSDNYFISFTAEYYPDGTSPIKAADLHLIILSAQALDGTPAPWDILENDQVRYFLIPGSVNLAAKGMDWYDYELLTEIFGISD